MAAAGSWSRRANGPSGGGRAEAVHDLGVGCRYQQAEARRHAEHCVCGSAGTVLVAVAVVVWCLPAPAQRAPTHGAAPQPTNTPDSPVHRQLLILAVSGQCKTWIAWYEKFADLI